MLKDIREDVENAGYRANKDASIYNYKDGFFDFKGPKGFYTGIRAEDAWEARYMG